MSDLRFRRLPCGCVDHNGPCYLAVVIVRSTPGMGRPRIVPPWLRGKGWPLPSGCEGGQHVGPLLNQDRFRRKGWRGMGNCRVCGSTVHVRTTQEPAASAGTLTTDR